MRKIIIRTFSVVIFLATILGVMQITDVPVRASDLSTEEYRAYQSGSEYKYPIVVNDAGNEIVAYCINAGLAFPAGKPGNIYKKVSDANQTDLETYSTSSPSRLDVLRTIYNGYGYNASNLQETYGLTDAQFRCVTQAAIWAYTDPSKISATYAAYSGEVGSDIVTINEAQAYLAWNADGSNYFKWTNSMDAVFEKLTSNTDQLKAVPDYLALNIYVSNESYIQNLLTVDIDNPGETSITVTKVWDDNNDQDGLRPDSIIVNLLANGEVVASQTVTADNDWNYAFTDLPKYDNGNEIVYTVDEATTPDGYTSSVDGTTITNTHTPETTEVSGTKTWADNDDQDGKRPASITVNLLANGTVVDTKTVTADDNWSYSFTDLPKYDNGNEITYTVTEDTVADYTTTYDGYNITNSYTPGETSITVTKAWDDNNDQDGIRPNSIQVQLYANGEESGDVITLTAADNWTYTWTGLAEKANGQDIVYTVEEVSAVDGYTATVGEVENGNVTITNTHTPTTPETPSSDEPTTPSQSNKKSDKGQDKKSSLPETGEQTTVLASIVGIVLVILGTLGIRKRKEDK